MSDINLAEAIKVIRPFMGCCVDCPHGHSGVDVADAEELLAAALPHLEQQIREQIAAEIAAEIAEPDDPHPNVPGWNAAMLTAARIARGIDTEETP